MVVLLVVAAGGGSGGGAGTFLLCWGVPPSFAAELDTMREYVECRSDGDFAAMAQRG